MNWAELVQEVYTKTNRADLVAETAQALRTATMECHLRDTFDKDIREGGIQLSTAAAIFQLDIPSLFPLYRQFSYLRIWDPVTVTPGEFFDLITPNVILDDYGWDRTQVAYVGGQLLNVRARGDISGLLYGYFALPVTAPVTAYRSWIAADYPDAIWTRAAAKVLRDIGNLEEANKQQEVAVNWLNLVVSAALEQKAR
jgi:hypothetical protein